MSDTVKGIYFAIIGAFSIAAMGVFVKYIGTDLNSITILFFRFAISLIVLLPFLFKSKTFSFKIKYPYHLTIRVLTGILAMTLYFVAIQHINLVNAILLESAYPIFVPIIIFFLTGQKNEQKGYVGDNRQFYRDNYYIATWHRYFSTILNCCSFIRYMRRNCICFFKNNVEQR